MATSSDGSPQIRFVVIQPSPFCNINCRYCYLPDRNSRKVMEERVLRKIYERLFTSDCLSEDVSLIWHAGEPLTVPIEFYERAASLLPQFSGDRIRVEQYFQTNATLITQEWCEFFKARPTHVSVSIDGPQWLHDSHRVTRNGNGTFDRAMRGVKLLQKNQIPFYNIAVLTADSLDCPDEIWQFFVDEGFKNLAFNLEETEGCNTQCSIRHPDDIPRFQDFFRRLSELRKTSGQNVHVRELDEMEERVRSAWSQTHCTLNSPLETLSFDVEGNISTFSPELLAAGPSKYGNLRFGNVSTCGIDDTLSNKQFLAVHDDIERGVARCRETCQYFSVCGGGEPGNKLAENGTFDSTETMHCRFTIQALCDVVLEGVEESLGLSSSPAPGSAVVEQALCERGVDEDLSSPV